MNDYLLELLDCMNSKLSKNAKMKKQESKDIYSYTKKIKIISDRLNSETIRFFDQEITEAQKEENKFQEHINKLNVRICAICLIIIFFSTSGADIGTGAADDAASNSGSNSLLGLPITNLTENHLIMLLLIYAIILHGRINWNGIKLYLLLTWNSPRKHLIYFQEGYNKINLITEQLYKYNLDMKVLSSLGKISLSQHHLRDRVNNELRKPKKYLYLIESLVATIFSIFLTSVILRDTRLGNLDYSIVVSIKFLVVSLICVYIPLLVIIIFSLQKHYLFSRWK